MTDLLLSALAAYLLGSIPFGLILAKYFGAGDLRAIGSGNIGATNVLRTGRKGLALATLLLDGLKGFAAAAWLPLCFDSFLIYLSWSCAFFALLGHCYPVWLKFKGGKGVATSGGGLLGAYWPLGLLVAGCWGLVFFKTRISSLAALSACLLTLVWGVLLAVDEAAVDARSLALILIPLLVTWRHRANIARLREGAEKTL